MTDLWLLISELDGESVGGLEQRWDMTCLSVLKRSALASGWRRGKREGKGEGTGSNFSGSGERQSVGRIEKTQGGQGQIWDLC